MTSAPRQGGRHDGRIVGIADRDVEIGGREGRCEEAEDVFDVLLHDLVATETRASQDVGELLGHLPRRDELEAVIAHRAESTPGGLSGTISPETQTFVSETQATG